MIATRTATTLAGLVLALGGLAACGGDDDGDGGSGGGNGGGSGGASEETAVSQTDFCDGFQELIAAASSNTDDLPAQIASVKEQVAELEDIGTPEGMPEDAESGFQAFAGAISTIEEDATQEDLQNLGQDFNEETQADGQAFLTWVQSNCMAESPSESPSESPAE